MLYFFITLIVIVSLLLVLVVMAQDSKGGGLVGNISPNQMMGVKKTTDLLERLTWGFAGAIMLLSIVSTLAIKGFSDEEETQGGVNVERAKSKTITTAPKSNSIGPSDATSKKDSGQ